MTPQAWWGIVELTATLQLLGGVSLLVAFLSTWLALQEHFVTRNTMAFDLYRAFGIAGLWWAAVAAVTLVEPNAWLLSVRLSGGEHLLIYSAWTLLSLGWMFAMMWFLIFRVQERIGWHAWQRDPDGHRLRPMA